MSSNPDCNNAADVPSVTCRTARSASPFVSERQGVDVRWFHEKYSKDLPNSSELSVLITFGFCDGSRNFRRLFSVSYEFFVFARIWLYGKILYHESVSVIVQGFTSFVEDFVLRCHQVTKLFCSWNGSLTVSSARNPRNFGCQAYVAISVFGEVRIDIVLLFRVSTFEASPSESEISLSEECAGTCVCKSSR